MRLEDFIEAAALVHRLRFNRKMSKSIASMKQVHLTNIKGMGLFVEDRVEMTITPADGMSFDKVIEIMQQAVAKDIVDTERRIQALGIEI